MEFFQDIFTKEIWEKAMSFASVIVTVAILLLFPVAFPDQDSKRRILIIPICIFVGWTVATHLLNYYVDFVISLGIGFFVMFTVAIILDRSRVMNTMTIPLSRFANDFINFIKKIGPYGALIFLSLLAMPLIWFWQMMFM